MRDNPGKITDFFSLRKRDGLTDVKEESFFEEMSKTSPDNSLHPFFQRNIAAAKRSRQREENDTRKWILRTCNSNAPLFPSIPLTASSIITNTEGVYSNQFNMSPRKIHKREIDMFPKFDFTEKKLYPQQIPTFTNRRERFNSEEFDEIYKRILGWITPNPSQDDDQAIENDKIFSGYFDFKVNTFNDGRPARKPIVLLTGPTGCGKSFMAEAFARDLAIPLKEINTAVAIRNGRPFEDLLVGSQGQRETLRKFVKSPSDYPTNREIEMVVLIDEVDIVFSNDKFYGPLAAFLKEIPPYMLVILTASSDIRILKRFIDLPPGILICEFQGKNNCEGERKFAFDCDWPLLAREPLGELPLCFHGLDDTPMACHEIRLKDPLYQLIQENGFMSHCKTRSIWNMEYRPYWLSLEGTALDRQKSRVRRTSRHIPWRGYLHGIPKRFVDLLFDSSFKIFHEPYSNKFDE